MRRVKNSTGSSLSAAAWTSDAADVVGGEAGWPRLRLGLLHGGACGRAGVLVGLGAGREPVATRRARGGGCNQTPGQIARDHRALRGSQGAFEAPSKWRRLGEGTTPSPAREHENAPAVLPTVTVANPARHPAANNIAAIATKAMWPIRNIRAAVVSPRCMFGAGGGGEAGWRPAVATLGKSEATAWALVAFRRSAPSAASPSSHRRQCGGRCLPAPAAVP